MTKEATQHRRLSARLASTMVHPEQTASSLWSDSSSNSCGARLQAPGRHLVAAATVSRAAIASRIDLLHSEGGVRVLQMEEKVACQTSHIPWP